MKNSIALLGLISLASASLAATLPTIYGYVPSGGGNPGVGAGFDTTTLSFNSVPIFISQFNTLGGTRTLTQVALTYEIYANVDQAAENNAGFSQQQVLSTDVFGNIKIGVTTLLTTPTTTTLNDTLVLAATDGNPNSGLDFKDFAPFSVSDSAAGNAGSLVGWSGLGNVTLLATLRATVVDPNLNNWSLTSAAIGNAKVGVTYTYTENETNVPEASTYASAMGLAGLVGFTWLRNRRK